MTADREVFEVPDLPRDLPEVTLADVVLELRRIADAVAPAGCGEMHAGAVCVLADRHRGPHVSGDGQTRWVDD